MTVKERVYAFVEYKGITIKSFEELCSLSNGYISSMRKGFGSDKLNNVLSKFPELNRDWLLYGEGEMLKIIEQNVSVANKFPLRTDRQIQTQTIPLYEIDATAGLVSIFDIGIQAPISQIQLPNLPPCDGAVFVRGDSMYPLLKSGDIVLYRQVVPSIENILWGEMYLLSFAIDGEEYITVKYIQKADRDGYVRLVSHNPHHSPKDIPADTIRALALIKASVRYCTMG